MKKISKTLLITTLGITTIFYGCSKEEDTIEEDTDMMATMTTPPTTDPCSGDDGFCMDYGGDVKSGPAVLTNLQSNKFRIFWESGSGSSFEQVELDIYSYTAGTYDVNDLAIPNSAFVQYFSAAGGVNNAAYGTVTVTTLDTINGVTGTFNVTMKDSTKITNATFTNIKK